MLESIAELSSGLIRFGLGNTAGSSDRRGLTDGTPRSRSQGNEVEISAAARALRSGLRQEENGSSPIAQILEKGLLAYIREKQEERLRAEALAQLGLTEGDLEAMSSEEREEVERKIQELIEEKIRERLRNQTAALLEDEPD